MKYLLLVIEHITQMIISNHQCIIIFVDLTMASHGHSNEWPVKVSICPCKKVILSQWNKIIIKLNHHAFYSFHRWVVEKSEHAQKTVNLQKKWVNFFSILLHYATICIRIHDSFNTSVPIFHGKMHHLGEEHFCAVVKLSEQFLKYLKSY